MESNSVAQEIERHLSTLGRIWVAEYLHAGAFDEHLNRELFDRLAESRPMKTGQWVALARRIQQAFAVKGKERATLLEGLAAQDFGEPGDRTHPVSRLMDFRNAFSHGGLNASVEDTRTHRILLSDLIGKISGLRKQPILFRKEGHALVADTGELWTSAVDGIAIPDYHPFIIGCDGKTILDLYPLLVVEEGKLTESNSTRRTHPITMLFEREVLRGFVERYQREKNGHLDIHFAERVRQRVTRAAPSIVIGEVDSALAAGHRLVCVEAHPGCGKAGVLTHLLDAAASNPYAGTGLWLIEPEDIGQSAIAFANFLLRQVERGLGLTDEALGSARGDWKAAMVRAKRALEQSGRLLLIGIEDLHAGCEPVRGEPVSVVDVYRSFAGGPITVVATTHPGRTPGRVPFDWRLPADRFPVPFEADIALDRLGITVHELCELCEKTHPMRLRVMKELVRQTQPFTLFALCDALETSGSPVFEPEVERALWDLRPLLCVTGGGDARTWKLFTPALARCLWTGGAQ